MMISFPFDSRVEGYDNAGRPIYDRASNAEQLAEWMRAYFTDGIFPDVGDKLQVLQDSGMTISVQPGNGNLRGRYFSESICRSLTAAPADTLARIDTVVIRLDLNTAVRSVEFHIVKGTAAAAPIAPALTRDASVWELGIANIAIPANSTAILQSAITDTRLDSVSCGIVAQAIKTLDTSAYYTQIQAALKEFQTKNLAAFDAWFAGLQTVLDGDVAGNLLNLINTRAVTAKYTATLTTEWLGEGPYTQMVTVTGLLETDTPMVDVVSSTVKETAIAQLEAWSCVGKLVAGADQMIATCFEDKPTTEIPIQIRVVR